MGPILHVLRQLKGVLLAVQQLSLPLKLNSGSLIIDIDVTRPYKISAFIYGFLLHESKSLYKLKDHS